MPNYGWTENLQDNRSLGTGLVTAGVQGAVDCCRKVQLSMADVWDAHLFDRCEVGMVGVGIMS